MIANSATGLLPFRSARICRARIFRLFGGRRTRIAGLLGLRGARLATAPGGRCAGIGLRVRSNRNGRNQSTDRGNCAERFQRVLQSRHFRFLLEPDGQTASGKPGSIADKERFAPSTRALPTNIEPIHIGFRSRTAELSPAVMTCSGGARKRLRRRYLGIRGGRKRPGYRVKCRRGRPKSAAPARSTSRCSLSRIRPRAPNGIRGM